MTIACGDNGGISFCRLGDGCAVFKACRGDSYCRDIVRGLIEWCDRRGRRTEDRSDTARTLPRRRVFKVTELGRLSVRRCRREDGDRAGGERRWAQCCSQVERAGVRLRCFTEGVQADRVRAASFRLFVYMALRGAVVVDADPASGGDDVAPFLLVKGPVDLPGLRGVGLRYDSQRVATAVIPKNETGVACCASIFGGNWG